MYGGGSISKWFLKFLVFQLENQNCSHQQAFFNWEIFSQLCHLVFHWQKLKESTRINYGVLNLVEVAQATPNVQEAQMKSLHPQQLKKPTILYFPMGGIADAKDLSHDAVVSILNSYFVKKWFLVDWVSRLRTIDHKRRFWDETTSSD